MKASSRRTLTTKAARGSDWTQEWEDVETVERLEALEALASHGAEPAEPDVTTEPIGDLMASLPDGPGPGRVAWWSMPLLALLILAPWTAIALIVWLLTG